MQNLSERSLTSDHEERLEYLGAEGTLRAIHDCAFEDDPQSQLEAMAAQAEADAIARHGRLERRRLKDVIYIGSVV